MGKTLRNLLLAVPVIALTCLSGCEKEEIAKVDKTPPKIKIISPVWGGFYCKPNLVTIKWDIEDENGDFKDAWISINNGMRVPLYPKSGSMDRHFKQNRNKIVIGAEDIYGNASKDSTDFYVSDIIRLKFPK